MSYYPLIETLSYTIVKEHKAPNQYEARLLKFPTLWTNSHLMLQSNSEQTIFLMVI